jgi:LysM repeat protein
MYEKAGRIDKKRETGKGFTGSLHPLINCKQRFRAKAVNTLYRQRNLGNQVTQYLAKSSTVQAKLKIGQPNDEYEQEAERVAKQVMRMPEGTSINGTETLVQRKPKCPECMEEEEEQLQRKEITGQTSEMTPGVESHIRHIKTGGQPLPESTRSFFEPRFGADFSHVRIHSGSEAAQAAQSVDAHAYTSGHNIVFNQYKYSPGTAEGKHLLAHELTHVIQQGDDQPDRNFEPGVSVHNFGAEPVLQRAQVGWIHGQGSPGNEYFIYELDEQNKLIGHLSNYYGVPIKDIYRINPGVNSSTVVHKGQRIKVPAINPPFNILPQKVTSISAGLTINTQTSNLNVRWNSGPDANIVGTVPRGTLAAIISPGNGFILALASLQNLRQGIVDMMTHLGLIASGNIYCFLPGANVRDLNTPASPADIDLMARMIWGEEKHEPGDSMLAAGWTARNRYDAGWGTYSQIITVGQYHGLIYAPDSKTMAALKGKDLAEWQKAQQIAKEIVEGTTPDPTGGALYFGNETPGTKVLSKMQKCARNNPEFKYARLGSTSLYYSNGDYTTQPSCPIR